VSTIEEIRCQNPLCNEGTNLARPKKLAEVEDGIWVVVAYRGLGIRIFANGAATFTCPSCGKETSLRLTTGTEYVTQINTA
jgi:hypothetical protein